MRSEWLNQASLDLGRRVGDCHDHPIHDPERTARNVFVALRYGIE